MSNRVKRLICIFLTFMLVLPFGALLCGCTLKPQEYSDNTGTYTIHLTYATIHSMYVTSNGEGAQTCQVPSYVMYKSRKITVKEIKSNASTLYGVPFIYGGQVNRLIIPSTIAKMDLSGYVNLGSVEEIDVSQNKRFEMIDGALYTKDKRQLLFCLYNYTGTLKIFRQTKSFLDKDGKLSTRGVFNGSNRFENVEVESGNSWCSSVNGALYTKDKSTLLYYSPYKKDTEYTLPKQFSMENPMPLLESNKFLQQIRVEDGNRHYKSIDGVLYSADGTNMAFYSRNRTSTTFAVPKELTHFIRTNSFMVNENLQSITVAADNTSFKSVDGVLYSKDGAELVFYPLAKQGKHFAVPSGVKAVGDYAFHNVQNLQTLFIPSSVERLDAYSVTGNIEYFVEGERREQYLRLESYGAAVHYGVTLEQYNEIISSWGDENEKTY